MAPDLEAMLSIPFWPLGPSFHRLCRAHSNLDPKLSTALDLAEACYARLGYKYPDRSPLSATSDSTLASHLTLTDTRKEWISSSSILSKISETPELEESGNRLSASMNKKRTYPSDFLVPNPTRIKLEPPEHLDRRSLRLSNAQDESRGPECINTLATPMGRAASGRSLASDWFEKQTYRSTRPAIPYNPDQEKQYEKHEESRTGSSGSFDNSWNPFQQTATFTKIGKVVENDTLPNRRTLPEERDSHRRQPSSQARNGLRTYPGHNSDSKYNNSPRNLYDETHALPDRVRSSIPQSQYSPSQDEQHVKDNHHMRIHDVPNPRGPKACHNGHRNEDRSRTRDFTHDPTHRERRCSETDAILGPRHNGHLNSPLTLKNLQSDSNPSVSDLNSPPQAIKGIQPDAIKKHFPLDRQVMNAIDRSVRLITDQYIVEAFCRIGLWLERKGVWQEDNWGMLKASDLARFLDIAGRSRLEKTLNRNRLSSFEDILEGSVLRGVIELYGPIGSRSVYLNKDFTPRGLFYRPLIKSLRFFFATEHTDLAEIKHLERDYLPKQCASRKLVDVLPPGCSTQTYVEWAEGEQV
ncbi:hypothetical protein CROQUDRAFT_722710, partial [Cronartium quercuum f. sp. fusiforme G11]